MVTTKSAKSCAATLVLVLVATLSACYSEQESAPRDPWSCSTSKDAFGEAFHACKAEGLRLLDPVFSLTVFCTTQEGSLPDDLSTGNISHRFSGKMNGRDMRLSSNPRSTVEVMLDDGPVSEWSASGKSPWMFSNRAIHLNDPGLETLSSHKGTILRPLVENNPQLIALRVVDDDGLRQSGEIRLGGMETALNYLEGRGCDRNALV